MSHCLIVGFGPGISLAVAQRFAREGFRISAIARNESSLRSYAEKFPSGYVWSAAHAGDEAQLRRAVDECVDRLGPVDVLVFNVAAMRAVELAQASVAEFRSSLEGNAVAALVTVQMVLGPMLDARKGTLLFTGGGLALHPMPYMGELAAGKSALRSIALTLAAELKPHGIHAATVTVAGTVAPGTFFAPEKIAEVYWQLHCEEPKDFRAEVVYRHGGQA